MADTTPSPTEPVLDAKRPSVSILVAAFNHADYIGALIESVLRQTYRDFELIIVDDGSTDATFEIACGYANNDPRVRVFRHNNRGVTATRNRAMELSAGDFVSIVDSDDLLPPTRLALQVDAIENQACVLVYGDAELIDASGMSLHQRFSRMYPPVSGPFSESLFRHYCFVPAITVMFRRSAFARTGAFWGPGHCTDYLKWIEIGLYGAAIRLPEVLGYWRMHRGNESSPENLEKVTTHYREVADALTKCWQKNPMLAEHIDPAALRARLSACYFMPGFYAASRRDYRRARKLFAQAVALSPTPRNLAGTLAMLPGICHFSSWLFRTIERNRFRRR